MERRHNNVAEGCSETDCKVACTMQNELKFQSTLKKSTFHLYHIPKRTCGHVLGEFPWTFLVIFLDNFLIVMKRVTLLSSNNLT